MWSVFLLKIGFHHDVLGSLLVVVDFVKGQWLMLILRLFLKLRTRKR